ncbi:MAG TPA: hypothetical protein VHA56_03450 [Mucilaginibacter sp.]|nr:hypothetical protein [Mucilaginibacter sp.]
MKQQIAATLSGSDFPVEGVARHIKFDGYQDAFEFKSIDNNLHLIIARDDDGEWIRVAGTEPYLGSWVEELARQVA